MLIDIFLIRESKREVKMNLKSEQAIEAPNPYELERRHLIT
jgi:hypothetical protein